MRLPRCETLVVAAALLSGLVVIDRAAAQTASSPAPPESPAAAAEAFVRSIKEGMVRAPNGRLVLASAHDNVVELRYVAPDAASFYGEKYFLDETQMSLLLCGQIPSLFLNDVVIHYVFALPDNRDHYEMTIDRSSCCRAQVVSRLADRQLQFRECGGVKK